MSIWYLMLFAGVGMIFGRSAEILTRWNFDSNLLSDYVDN